MINEIRKRFYKALEQKTTWGRNEIKQLFDNIIIEVLTTKKEA